MKPFSFKPLMSILPIAFILITVNLSAFGADSNIALGKTVTINGASFPGLVDGNTTTEIPLVNPSSGVFYTTPIPIILNLGSLYTLSTTNTIVITAATVIPSFNATVQYSTDGITYTNLAPAANGTNTLTISISSTVSAQYIKVTINSYLPQGIPMLINEILVNGSPTVFYKYDVNGNRTSRSISLSHLKSAKVTDSVADTDNVNNQKDKYQDSIGNFNVNIYPNPTRGKLFIEITGNKNNEAVHSFEIYDLRGQKLQTINEAGTSGYLDFSSFKAGIYIMKINIGNNSRQWKIIKQ